jgi:type III pantothenate kinase
MTIWLGLIIGNSRLHWAQFEANQLQRTWDTVHFTAEAIAASLSLSCPPIPLPPDLEDESCRLAPLVMASVVPTQTPLWRNRPNVVEISLAQIQLVSLYPSLGIDRALAALGAFHQWNTSVLIIDGGTALTFTGIDDQGALVGGAIAPGFRLQLQTLHDQTATLPDVALDTMPSMERWAMNTPEAIVSGVWHSLVAGTRDFIQTWRREFPLSHVVLTGGDGNMLYQALGQQWEPWQGRSLHLDPHIGFRGMAIAYTQIMADQGPT